MTQHRQLATPTYLVAFALTFIPPFDALTQVFPFRLGEARWRFGAFGLVSNSLMFSLTGLVIALIAASVFEHRRVRRVIGVAAVLGLLGVAAAWIIFVLDALQVQGGIKPAAALAFKVASSTAAVKALIAMLTLGAAAAAAFRRPRTAATPKGSSRAANLIVAKRGPSQEAAAHSGPA